MSKYLELKIKIKSLSDESRLIRQEEKKLPGSIEGIYKRNSLHHHRTIEIRRELRATYLAYGYLRGRSYHSIEQCPRYLRAPYDRPGPILTRVRDMVMKYSLPDQRQPNQRWDKEMAYEAVKAWTKEAPAKAA